MKSRILAAALAATAITGVAIVPVTPANAQFGGVVFDPKNYAQNLLTAARTLQPALFIRGVLKGWREWHKPLICFRNWVSTPALSQGRKCHRPHPP